MRVLATLSLIVACGAGTVMTAGQPSAETVDQLIARHLAARGGIDRIKSVQTLKMTRTVPTIGATLNLVIYKKRGGLYRSEQSAPGRPTTVRGLGPDGLWELAGDKVTTRSEAMATELRELDGDIDGPLVDYGQKGHSVELEGRATEAGIEVYRLNLHLKSGARRRILLDAATLLERKHIGTITLPPDRTWPPPSCFTTIAT